MKKRFSPSRSKVVTELNQRQNFERQSSEENKIPISRSADYNKYFCHYNNAVYMGGISAYKKHGKGVLLHDDGSSVITDYLHDSPTGQTIIFRQNSITSMVYSSPYEFDIAYKQGHYILTIPFVDNSFLSHGAGILIDYLNHKIYRLTFKKGVLVQKILHLDKQDNEDAFARNTITRIIGVKHEQAFSLTFERPNKVHVKTEKNKTTIGYFDDVGQLNGLAFTFYSQNLTVNGEKPLYLKSIERGYYRNSVPEVFGDKIFSNGNKYIGEFQKGFFHGFGLLISPEEMKWVYGRFIKGQLNNIEDSNYKQYEQSQYNVWSENLRFLHKRYRERWIDQDIDLPDEYYLYKHLKVALVKEMTHVEPDRKELLKGDHEKMSRIQQQFELQIPGSMQNSKVQRELDRHYQSQTPKGPIKIEDLAPIFTKQGIPSTPVSKFLSSSVASKDRQYEYRMEDPFKIDLIKVPVERSYSNREQQLPYKPSSRFNQESEAEQLPLYPKHNQYEQPTLNRFSYKYLHENQTEPYRNSRQELNTRAIIEDYRKSREKSDPYRGRVDSPGRTLYESPIQNDYPERYVGRITNKRHFNYDTQDRDRETILSKYPTTSKYYPTDKNYEYDIRSRSPASLYSPPLRAPSPKESDGLYSERKKFAPLGSKGDTGSNFIKNNYKYWS